MAPAFRQIVNLGGDDVASQGRQGYHDGRREICNGVLSDINVEVSGPIGGRRIDDRPLKTYAPTALIENPET